MALYKEKLYLDFDAINAYETIINGSGDKGQDILAFWIVRFEDGCYAEIKVCGGNFGYVSPELYNDEGMELIALDVRKEICGIYEFRVWEDLYTVEIFAV